MRGGGPREPEWRAGGLLFLASAPAQPAEGSEAESPSCGEGEEGARLPRRHHLRPTFLGGWRRSPRKSRGDSEVRPLFDPPPKWLRLHPGAGRCCVGFCVRLRPWLQQLRGDPRPAPSSPTPPCRGPPTCRLPVSLLSSLCLCIGSSVVRSVRLTCRAVLRPRPQIGRAHV